YYAGLTPSKGLSFSGDITVYPLSQAPLSDRSDSGLARRLAWRFERPNDSMGVQHLESGWLQSRIQTQLVTARSRKSDFRLDIRPQGDACSVTNRLGVPVSYLFVRGADDKYWSASGLGVEEKAELAKVAVDDAPTMLIS